MPNNDPNQTTAEPPTSTPTAIPTSSVAAANPTTTATTTTAATDTNAASVGTDPYLAELKVLQDASSVYYNKTYEVSDQPYVHSILAECGSNCTTQKKISYNLGKKYRRLTFGVGIEDNSATREQVAVFGNFEVIDLKCECHPGAGGGLHTHCGWEAHLRENHPEE